MESGHVPQLVVFCEVTDGVLSVRMEAEYKSMLKTVSVFHEFMLVQLYYTGSDWLCVYPVVLGIVSCPEHAAYMKMGERRQAGSAALIPVAEGVMDAARTNVETS